VIDAQGIDVHDMPTYFLYVGIKWCRYSEFKRDGWITADDGHVFDGGNV
jgi:hypothetical protein